MQVWNYLAVYLTGASNQVLHIYRRLLTCIYMYGLVFLIKSWSWTCRMQALNCNKIRLNIGGTPSLVSSRGPDEHTSEKRKQKRETVLCDRVKIAPFSVYFLLFSSITNSDNALPTIHFTHAIPKTGRGQSLAWLQDQVKLWLNLPWTTWLDFALPQHEHGMFLAAYTMLMSYQEIKIGKYGGSNWVNLMEDGISTKSNTYLTSIT